MPCLVEGKSGGNRCEMISGWLLRVMVVWYEGLKREQIWGEGFEIVHNSTFDLFKIGKIRGENSYQTQTKVCFSKLLLWPSILAYTIKKELPSSRTSVTDIETTDDILLMTSQFPDFGEPIMLIVSSVLHVFQVSSLQPDPSFILQAE